METTTNKSTSSKSWILLIALLVIMAGAWFILNKPLGKVSPQSNLASPPPNSWTYITPMPTPVRDFGWVQLDDGRIFTVGGYTLSNANNTYTGIAQIYNPATGVWSSAGSTNWAAAHMQVTNLGYGDGRILITGGYKLNNNNSTTVFNKSAIYYPLTNTWNANAGTMTVARYGHKTVGLSNGKALVVGGGIAMPAMSTNSNCLQTVCKTAEIYDPATSTFTATPALSYPKQHFSLIHNMTTNRVWAIGGMIGTCSSTGSVEIYDVATNTWSVGPSLNTPRNNATARGFGPNKIIIMGGWDCNGVPVLSSEIYDPTTNAWTVISQPQMGYVLATQVIYGNNTTIGPSPITSPAPSTKIISVDFTAVHMYDSATNSWSTVAPFLGTPNTSTYPSLLSPIPALSKVLLIIGNKVQLYTP